MSVLLSEEQALAPHEECYHRLLAQSLTEASELAEAHLKANSLTALYDGVLIPALILAENDARSEELDPEQQGLIHQQMLDIIEDVGELPPTPSKVAADVTVAEDTPPVRPVPAIRVRCLPARAYRDELAGIMLTQVLINRASKRKACPPRSPAANWSRTCAKHSPMRSASRSSLLRP